MKDTKKVPKPIPQLNVTAEKLYLKNYFLITKTSQIAWHVNSLIAIVTIDLNKSIGYKIQVAIRESSLKLT